MRKLNEWIVKIMIILFLIHGLFGSFLMLGISSISLKPLAYTLLILVLSHAVIGMMQTKNAVKSGMRSGHWYKGLNAAFWIKRISGVAILVLLCFHIGAYTTEVNGKFFLAEFTWMKMVTQLLFVLAIGIHLFVSIRPMLIRRGIIKYKERTVDYLLVLAIFHMIFVAAIISYYIQWNF